MTNKAFSIYVHIPFCISKCKYCAFYSEKYSEDIAKKYVAALKDTASYFSEKYTSCATVETIYFGGGTPTSIGAELLCELIFHLKNLFRLSENCEITIEANPKTVSEKDALMLKNAGVNRISLGIQTTDNEKLKTLGRIHTWEDAKTAFGIFKKTGFDNVSVDLMYGLPSQNEEDLNKDIINLLSLNPSHVSTYALSVEEGTPFFENRDKYDFPDENQQADYYDIICSALSCAGYSHYEISNFAKSGFESKHNMGYWSRRDYIGLGAGAHSLWDNKRFNSIANRNEFIDFAKNKNFDAALGINNPIYLSEEDVKEENVMLSLRTSKGVYVPFLSKKLEEFVKNGFARYNNGFYSLTDKGFFVSNTIIYYVCKELLYDK